MHEDLCTKTATWRQGMRPPGATHRVGRPCAKKEAAKKFLVRKKTLPRSQHHYDKTVRRLRWRCADIKGRLHISKGSRWPPQAAAPSLLSCVASHGRASSSQTCLLATTAPPTLRSSCSSTS